MYIRVNSWFQKKEKIMASQAQINANRKNALKSTGPKTAEGKEVSSQNAFKHGLFVKKAVVRDENQGEYDLHYEAMMAEWNPVGPMEKVVAERLINLTWRLERAQRMQNQAMDYLSMGELEGYRANRFDELYRNSHGIAPDEDLGVPRDHMILGRLSVRDFINYRSLDRMLLYERRIESSMYRAMKELQKLQQRRMDKEAIANRDHAGQNSTVNKQCNLKKRTQFAPGLMGTMSCAASGYGDQLSPEAAANKANHGRIAGCSGVAEQLKSESGGVKTGKR